MWQSHQNFLLSRRHFQQSHVSHAVLYKDVYCYPPKQPHGSQGKSIRAHHCLICTKTALNKTPFRNHLETHNKSGDGRKKENANGQRNKIEREEVEPEVRKEENDKEE